MSSQHFTRPISLRIALVPRAAPQPCPLEEYNLRFVDRFVDRFVTVSLLSTSFERVVVLVKDAIEHSAGNVQWPADLAHEFILESLV